MEQTIETVITNWELADIKQLNNYRLRKLGKRITVGDITYKVSKTYMNDNKAPMVELVAMNSNRCQWVQLALIDREYKNYSALSDTARTELLESLGV